MDSVPVVGAGYRTVRAVTAHICGDHEEAAAQWQEAGMNIAGDALGLVTGGAGKAAAMGGKFAVAGAKAAGKAVVKAGGKAALKQIAKGGMKGITKQALKKAAKTGARAALREGRKRLSRKGMKTFAKKYIKKKIKQKAKKKVKEAGKEILEGIQRQISESGEGDDEAGEDSDVEGEVNIDSMRFFSGVWRGYYSQYGTNYDVQCVLVFDWDRKIAGKGSDTVSNYTVSGQVNPDGQFEFRKVYSGPTAYHTVTYEGTVEMCDQPVLQGEWCIETTGQRDRFALVLSEVGLDSGVVCMSCVEASAALAMTHDQKRREIVEGLLEVLEGADRDQLTACSDEDLVSLALTLAVEEEEEEESDE